jgi:hypothetical protein
MATYTSAAAGLWSAGATWVGGVKPPSGAGHKIVLAHIVTFDEAAGTYGDDTSSTTVASNGISTSGSGGLKFSRAVSTALTCRGTLAIGPGGSLDMGTVADPIPSGITATLLLNDSATLAIGKHGLYAIGTGGTVTVNMQGVARTRATTLSASASAGATSIQVAAASNWAVGDTVELASDTVDQTRSHYTTITSVSGTTIGIGALNFARASGCAIINLTSNVVVKASSTANPSFATLLASPSTSTSNHMAGGISNVRFENLCSTGGWVGSGGSNSIYFGLMLNNNDAAYDYTAADCSFEWSHGLTTQTNGVMFGAS